MHVEAENPEELYIRQESGPFWMVIKNSHLYKSDRLTAITDDDVKFVADSLLEYNALTEGEKLWFIEAYQGAARIMNSQSKKYLQVRIKDGEVQGLACKDFDEENVQTFLWNVQLNIRYKGFIIRNSAPDKHGKFFELLESTHKNFTEEQKGKLNNLVLFPERQFKINKKGITELQETSRVQAVIESKLKSKQISEEQYKKLKSVIPNFSGIAFQSQNSFYRFFANQYATSSYPQQKMTPFMICYPQNVEDVKSALLYAISKNKKVVARSGGHQYSGKSSGDQNTIVVDMGYDSFTKIVERNQNLIDISPGVRLKHLSKFLGSKGYFLPHGQCPLVCIGGHGQTGGYGNLLRSFGLNGDHIEGFQIVTTDGKDVKVYELTRPNSKLLKRSEDIDEQFNNKFFTGVLSGNAGSFGIITRYTYKFHKDQDHPNSRAFRLVRSHNKKTLKALLEEFMHWSVKTKDKKGLEELRGLDYFLSLGSRTLPSWISNKFRFSPMICQLLYSDLDGKPYESKPDKSDPFGRIETIIRDGLTKEQQAYSEFIGAMSGATVPTKEQRENLNKVSQFARSTVRRWPTITYEGRQHFEPYRKRGNLTCDVLTPAFVEQFCDILDEVQTKSQLKIICQMQCGSGQCEIKGRELNQQGFVTYPFRDFTFGFTFDVFYRPSQLKEAQMFQDKMQKIVDKHLSNPTERRNFWASFGNTNIEDPEVRKMYYESEAQYEKLQQLKARVDPTDIFHTDMTVKLPKKN